MQVQLHKPANHFHVEWIQKRSDLPQSSLAEYLVERLCEQTGAAFVCLHFSDRGMGERLPGCCRLCPPAIAPRADMALLKAAEELWQKEALAARRPVSLGEALTRLPEIRTLSRYLGLCDGHSIPLLYKGHALGTLNIYLLEGRLTVSEVTALASLGALACGLMVGDLGVSAQRPALP